MEKGSHTGPLASGSWGFEATVAAAAGWAAAGGPGIPARQGIIGSARVLCRPREDEGGNCHKPVQAEVCRRAGPDGAKA